MALLLNDARRSRVAAMELDPAKCERLAELDEERLDDAFDEIFQVNVKSQLVCVKAALAELRPI